MVVDWQPIPTVTEPHYLDDNLNQVQKCVNWFHEKTPAGLVLRGLSGNKGGATAPNGAACRGGAYDSRRDLYISVNGNTVYQVAENASLFSAFSGTLSTSSGDVVVVEGGSNNFLLTDGTFGYIIETLGFTVTKITDANFPTNPISCTCFNNQFIVVDGSGSDRWYMSAVDNGLLWTPVISGRSILNPDPILHVLALRDTVYFFGSRSVELWVASSSDPYLQPVTGAVMPVGLDAYYPFQSVAVVENSIYLRGNNRGHFSFYRITGSELENITAPAVQGLTETWSNSPVYGVAYSVLGQEFYEVYSGSGSNHAWVYNITSGTWCESDPNRTFRCAFNGNAGIPLALRLDGKAFQLGTASLQWNQQDVSSMTRTLDFKLDGGMGRTFNQGLRFEFEAQHDSLSSYTFSMLLQKSDDGGRTFDTGITLSKAVANGTSAQQVVLISPPLGSFKAGRTYRTTISTPARLILRRAEGLVRVGRF